MILGSNCSPCCDPQRCTLDEFIAIYDLFRSSNVSVSISGSTPPLGEQYVYLNSAAGYIEGSAEPDLNQIFVICSGTSAGAPASSGPVALRSSSFFGSPLDFQQSFSVEFAFDATNSTHVLSRRAFISGLRRGGRCTFSVSASSNSFARRFSSGVPITAFDNVTVRTAVLPHLTHSHYLDFIVDTEAVELGRPSDLGFMFSPNVWVSGKDYGNADVRAAERMIDGGTLDTSPDSLGVGVVPLSDNNPYSQNRQSFQGFSNDLFIGDVANGFPAVFNSGNTNYSRVFRMPTQEYYDSLALGATHRTLTSHFAGWWNNFVFTGGQLGVLNDPDLQVGAAATFDRDGVVVVADTGFSAGPAISATLSP